MKTITIIYLPLLFFSCFSKHQETRKTDRLNERITRLEQRIDSLDCNGSISPARVKNMCSRCQAITKRGKQCRRKAKNNGYCWQHAG